MSSTVCDWRNAWANAESNVTRVSLVRFVNSSHAGGNVPNISRETRVFLETVIVLRWPAILTNARRENPHARFWRIIVSRLSVAVMEVVVIWRKENCLEQSIVINNKSVSLQYCLDSAAYR